jgi:predicted transcriptional regulator
MIMSDADKLSEEKEDIRLLTAEIAASYFTNNQVQEDRIGSIIHSIAAALNSLPGSQESVKAAGANPAVPIKKSVTPSAIICLDCGDKQKMIKRHIRTAHDLSPEEYREKWSLPKDYPFVAPSYAKQRSELAKKIGLGRKPKGKK